MGNFIGALRLKLHPAKTPVAGAANQALVSPRTLVLPLAMAQFLASYDTQAMTVAISQIVEDLDTTVIGVQTAMSIFTLTMAALMTSAEYLACIDADALLDPDAVTWIMGHMLSSPRVGAVRGRTAELKLSRQ